MMQEEVIRDVTKPRKGWDGKPAAPISLVTSPSGTEQGGTIPTLPRKVVAIREKTYASPFPSEHYWTGIWSQDLGRLLCGTKPQSLLV